MKKLVNQISFIGVDERTDIDKMFYLQKQSKLPLEFGVLYSPSKNGKANRYPTHEWSKNFARINQHVHIKKSLHLCGQSVKNFLDDPESMRSLWFFYDRIQLNFSMSEYKNYPLEQKLVEAMFITLRPLILQHNNSKDKFLREFMQNQSKHCHLLHVLFDASGGRGQVIENVQQAFENIYCGYAGGIGPETVKNIVEKVEEVNVGTNNQYYIDMESKIRDDNDWFSLDKCASVIEVVNNIL